MVSATFEVTFERSREIWRLLAEEGLRECIFVACRTDVNRDIRTGTEWEEVVILAENDNYTRTTYDDAKSLKNALRSLFSGFVLDISVL